MPSHMFPNKAGDEIIGMVIAGLQAMFDRLAMQLRLVQEQGRVELVFEELIGLALINQDRCLRLPLFDQFGRVIGFPRD